MTCARHVGVFALKRTMGVPTNTPRLYNIAHALAIKSLRTYAFTKKLITMKHLREAKRALVTLNLETRTIEEEGEWSWWGNARS